MSISEMHTIKPVNIKKRKIYMRKHNGYFPDDSTLIFRQIVLALFEGKTADANELIEKYKSLLKENSVSEATIATKLALIYAGAGIPDQAEAHYRQALSLHTDNLLTMINLGISSLIITGIYLKA